MIVHDHGLHAPALVSSTGALCTAAFTRLLVFFGVVNVKPVGPKPWDFAFRRALPVGVFAAGSLCFGNMSYIYLDAGFVQMLKTGTPALLLLVLSVMRVEKVSFSTASLAMLMVLGSTLASLQQPNATPLGLAIQMTSQLCEVLQCTAMQIFLQQLGFEAWDAGYYLAPAVASCCLLPSLILEWPHLIANHEVGVLYEQAPLLMLSGMIGIIVNFSSTFVIKYTSSLLAKLLVIVRSSCLVLVFILNGEPYTSLQVVGYVITIGAFVGYSVVKAREVEAQNMADEQAEASRQSSTTDTEAQESDLELLEPATPMSTIQADNKLDLTSSMFWFAIFVVVAGAYQATVIGDLPSPCAFIERELSVAPYTSVSSGGMPPTPYLEPITAGTRHRGDQARKASQNKEHGDRWHTDGALSVESAAKVLKLKDGRFLQHSGGEVVIGHRTPEAVLSSSWMLSSKQFGTVYLSSLNNKGALTWLSCELELVWDWTQACLFWMSASRFDHWAPAEGERGMGEYTLRKHSGDEDLYLAVNGSRIVWSPTASPVQVDDWLPEACSMTGMTPSKDHYSDALGEVTFTMTTYFHVYARSVMFRQALASVFTHLKERDLYVKEFLVVNDWYDGRSLAFNGTFTGPKVDENRQEMLNFFPGCVGASTEVAKSRPKDQKCSFVFKTAEERGQPKALNILFDLMVTKFWIHFEDDKVFFQDVFISRLLAPMYEHPESCWQEQQQAQAVKQLPAGTSSGGESSDWGSVKSVPQRKLSQAPEQGQCLRIASIRLGGHHTPSSSDVFDVEDYVRPKVLHDNNYVRALLAHGGFDDDKSHGWGNYSDVGAVQWPLFSLRPSLHNLTYIKSLEAPLFCGGEPGHFSEDHNITVWEDGGKTYEFHWDFELEFAVRWARGGATVATISPGACMRDVSNGISSFERSFEYR